MVTDSQLDELIKQALQEEMESIEVTPEQVEEGWQRLKLRLEEHRFGGRLRPRRTAGPWMLAGKVAVVLVLFVSLSLNLVPDQAKAVGNRFFSSIWQRVAGDSFNVFISTQQEHEQGHNAKVPPPPEEDDLTVLEPDPPQELSMDEIRKVAVFRPFIPSYLPAGYQLKRSTYQVLYQNSARVYLEYDGGQEIPLRIEQENILGPMGAGIGFNKDDAEARQVKINGYPGVLIVFKRGHASLIWMQNNVRIDLSGPVSAEEITKIAESMHQ